MIVLARLLRRYPLEALGALGSLVFRFYWIFVRAPAEKFVFSDMSFYVFLAKQMKNPDFHSNPGNFTHPPGMAWLIRGLGGESGADTPLKLLFFGMSFFIPLLIALTARRLFDRRAARFCFWAATLYSPFWQYGSFLIAELPLIFLVSLSAWLAAVLFCTRVSGWKMRGLALLLGGVAGGSLAFKITPLPGILVLIAGMIWGRRRKILGTEVFQKIKPALLVFVLVLAALSVRGTMGTGKFNLGTNKFPGDFLIGNMGRIGLVEFQGGGGTWGSPTSANRGWYAKLSVPQAMWDSDSKNPALIWMQEHPWEAVAMDHVKLQAFLFDPPWPLSSTDDFWNWTQISLFWMSTLGYFLALLGWWTSVRRSGVDGVKGIMEKVFTVETALALPVLALMGSLLLTSAEARYRVPLDPLILLLAGSGFSRGIFGRS